MKRLFIATPIIELSPEIKTVVADLKYKLRHNDIVWVKDEVRHLTLRFLGATPPQKVPEIRDALWQTMADTFPFKLKINKIGVFGSKYQPNVIWLGFKEFGEYKVLFDKLEPKLQEIGFEPNEGNFVPHITLCRIKNTISKQKFWKSFEEIAQTPFEQEIEISNMILYQSFLNKEGPEYKVLAKAECRDKKNDCH